MESLVPLANWQDPASRRREALRALQERDEGALQALLQVYLQTKSRKRTALSPRTLETYQLALRDYLSWIWPKEAPAPRFPLQKATSDDLDRYLAELQARGGHLTASPKPFRPAAAATYLAGIRAFYRALEWAGVAHPPHVSAPHDPTPAYERRPALPPSLYQTLLQRLTPQDPRSLRDRVAVRLMGEGGLRISEVVALNLEDLLLPERLLLVRKGKGGKARSLPLSRSLIEDLQHWLKVRASHAWPHETALLVHLRGRKAGGRRMGARGLREILNRYYRELGFPARYSGAHILRHTAGTRFYRVSRDLQATARILGHADVSTAAIYAKMDVEGLYELVDRAEEEL